ncbi:WcaI family glycosyltransferase [Rhizobium halophytocola]|uniref:Colanic acid biosynthesis glycosyl transferase WcaI n=1 Tax=Rhizobium halophytocola TaxID=735519 RepID=A0ABS4E097_9HYPH|nr:WcaI family glycosyltransferase [Rhizobium halophytocola]MBP1851358.1 colanic acid biosynthesis glycosyl transferase WcaI [Rhizobium halophytocola]
MTELVHPGVLEAAPVQTAAKTAEAVGRLKCVVVYGMNFAPEMAGVGRYTGEIAEYMAEGGARVVAVTTPPHYPGWRVRNDFANRYSAGEEGGVRVIRVPLMLREKMGGIWRLLAPLSFAVASAPVVIWQILRWRPQVVFCVEPTLFAAPAAQFAAWLSGSRTVLHVQDLEVDAAFAVGHLKGGAWLRKLGFVFERFALGRFGRIVTISSRMAEKIASKGVRPERISIVRNWVDLSYIFPLKGESPYRAELGYQPDHFVVLYSGNIGAKQGLNILLDAADRLQHEPRLKFVVAGEGPAKSELMQRYAHLANVRFLPFQPYERLNEFLSMADLHALPQEKGAADLVLPSKLGGMLASGKQIVVTADPGTELADFLGDLAYMTPPGDGTALAEAIVRASIEPKGTTEERLDLARKLSRTDGLVSLVNLVASRN